MVPSAMPAMRTTAHDDAVKVRPFEAEDEPQVLDVLKAAFGAWPGEIERGAPAEFFRWKHMASPFGPSVLMVAETDGEVIGFYAYMAWRFRAQVGVLTTMRGVDLAVHPAHRRRGVSLAIRAEPEFSDDVAFFWSNPNEPSRPGSLMAGRHRVGKFPRFARPCGRLRETIRRAREQGSKTPAQLQVEADTASEILGDGAPASALLGQAKGVGDRLQTAKDLDYLRWRYGRFEDYRAVQTDAGQAGGLVIFRPRRLGPFWVLDVCELFVERNDYPTARHLLGQVSRTAPADFISCSFASGRDAALCGFVQSPGGMVLMAAPLQQNLAPDPTKRASWALSRGDLELL